MKIRKEDYPVILDHMVNKRWEGYEYVGFLDDNYPLCKDDLTTLFTHYDAMEFCHEMSTDIDRYDYLSIRSVYKTMQEAAQDSRLMIEKNGVVDVSWMVQVRNTRIESERLNNEQNSAIMNNENFGYLKDNIKYLGFGEKQHDKLEAHLKEGKEAFQMTYATEVNKKPFEAVLNFRKSDKSDMYFLNNYQATLERSNGEKMEQTFYLNKGKGITAKEAYNLLEGRAVHKELTNKAGEPYKAWIQLDFDNKDKNNNYEVNQYHEKYGYDLKAAVGKYFVMEMDGGEEEKALLQSLQKGNIQSVSINVNGETQKMFIEANPQYKTINLYNDKMQRLNQEQRLDISQKQSGEELKEDKKQDQQQEVKPENKKSVKQNPADDLGKQKKGRSRKKGMSV